HFAHLPVFHDAQHVGAWWDLAPTPFEQSRGTDTLERHHAAGHAKPNRFGAGIEYQQTPTLGHLLQPEQPERVMQARREQGLDKGFVRNGRTGRHGLACERKDPPPLEVRETCRSPTPPVASLRAVVAGARCRTYYRHGEGAFPPHPA